MFSQREVGSHTGSVTAWLKALEYFLRYFGIDRWDKCHSVLSCRVLQTLHAMYRHDYVYIFEMLEGIDPFCIYIYIYNVLALLAVDSC